MVYSDTIIRDVSHHFDGTPHKLVKINPSATMVTIWDKNANVVERIDTRTDEGQARLAELTQNPTNKPG